MMEKENKAQVLVKLRDWLYGPDLEPDEALRKELNDLRLMDAAIRMFNLREESAGCEARRREPMFLRHLIIRRDLKEMGIDEALAGLLDERQQAVLCDLAFFLSCQLQGTWLQYFNFLRYLPDREYPVPRVGELKDLVETLGRGCAPVSRKLAVFALEEDALPDRLLLLIFEPRSVHCLCSELDDDLPLNDDFNGLKALFCDYATCEPLRFMTLKTPCADGGTEYAEAVSRIRGEGFTGEITALRLYEDSFVEKGFKEERCPDDYDWYESMGKVQQRLREDPFSLPCKVVLPLDFVENPALREMLLRWRRNFKTGTSRGRIDKRVYGELLQAKLKGQAFNYVCILDQSSDEKPVDWGETAKILRDLVDHYAMRLTDLDPDVRQANPPFLKEDAEGYLYFDEKEFNALKSLRDCKLWLSTDLSLTPETFYRWQIFKITVEWYANGACLPAVPQHLLKGLDPQGRDVLALICLRIFWLEILHHAEFVKKTGKGMPGEEVQKMSCVYDGATGEYVFTRKLKAQERLFLKTLGYTDIARQV